MDTDAKAAVAVEEEIKPIEIDLADIDAADESEMVVTHNGKLTTWVWTFAGPGHPKGVAQSNRMARERLHEDKLKEQARTNGKKWTKPEETPDEARRKNATFVVERLLRWTPVKLNGERVEFSEAEAMRILIDPRKISLLVQALEFLNEDASFIKRAATN